MNILSLLKGSISQDDLLRYYNAKIIITNIPYSSIRGFVDYYKGYNFIYINKNLSYYKRKKTLLHELAHIELNQLCQVDKDLFAFHINEYEDEADRYLKFIKESLEEFKI